MERKMRKNITHDVKLSLKKYLGVSSYPKVSILYCRNCHHVLGEVSNSSCDPGWFDPGRMRECGCIPDYGPNLGILIGPDTARNIIALLGFA